MFHIKDKLKQEEIIMAYDKLHSEVGMSEEFYSNTVENSLPFLGNYILDVGCGNGRIIELVQNFKTQSTVVGIEPSLNMCLNCRSKKLNVVRSVSENLPFKENTFDAIFITEVLERLVKPEVSLKELSKVLKKRGHLILVTPNKNWLMNFLPENYKSSRYKPLEQPCVSHFSHLGIYEILRKNGFSPKVWRKSGPLGLADRFLSKLPFNYLLSKRIWVIAEKC